MRASLFPGNLILLVTGRVATPAKNALAPRTLTNSWRRRPSQRPDTLKSFRLVQVAFPFWTLDKSSFSQCSACSILLVLHRVSPTDVEVAREEGDVPCERAVSSPFACHRSEGGVRSPLLSSLIAVVAGKPPPQTGYDSREHARGRGRSTLGDCSPPRLLASPRRSLRWSTTLAP